MAQQHHYHHPVLPPVSTQLLGISAGSLSYPLVPILVDKMMSGREKAIFACVSLRSRKTQVWVISPVKETFAAMGCQGSGLLWPGEHVVFPDPPPKKNPQVVPREAQVGFPVWPLETWEHVGS